jgi:ABC-type polar amino acid transport system ATPase subunit
LFYLTVIQNISRADLVRKVPNKAEEMAYRLLNALASQSRHKSIPVSFRGQQQRVAIARALAMEPKIVPLTSRPQRSIQR